MAHQAVTSGDTEAFQVKRIHNMVVSYFTNNKIVGKWGIRDQWIMQRAGYVSAFWYWACDAYTVGINCQPMSHLCRRPLAFCSSTGIYVNSVRPAEALACPYCKD